MLPNRKHVRMQNFDYATPGAYFFTICVESRNIRFGRIRNGTVQLNDVGRMIEDIWLLTATQFPTVEIDAFVLMPDHTHGIWIVNSGDDFGLSSVSFINVIQWFTSATTNAYGRGVAELDWPRYDKRLWQRDYFERYLRNDKELEEKRAYIDGNPERWQERMDSLRR